MVVGGDNLDIIDAKSWIVQQIKENNWKKEKTIPSSYEIATLLNLPISVINQAMKMLVSEGVLINYFADEYYVKPEPLAQSGIEKLESITEMIEQTGQKAGSIIINITEVNAAFEESKYLNVALGEPITVIERIRTANTQPVVYCIEKIPTKYLPENVTIDLFQEPMLKLLEIKNNFKFDYAVAEIEPVSYDETISQGLECTPFEALLLLKQTHVIENNTPILYSLNYFKSSKLQFKVIRKV